MLFKVRAGMEANVTKIEKLSSLAALRIHCGNCVENCTNITRLTDQKKKTKTQ